MTIQWFPGHMAKARRQIQEKLKLIDVVIELLDARIPLSSRNPMIDEILQGKPRLVVLNKVDLSDPKITEQWIEYFAANGLQALPVDASSGYRMNEIIPRCKQLVSAQIERQLRKGINPRAIRGLIVGIPNVGKSTLINQLSGRGIAATGDRPGITKGQQWIKIGKQMELLDTPGILWPKFEDPEVGLKLASTGAIKEEILHPEEVAVYSIRFLIRQYPQELKQRFSLSELPAHMAESEEIIGLMEQIGRKRGCMQSGGTVNLEQAAGVILRDMRAGKMGRISMETPS